MPVPEDSALYSKDATMPPLLAALDDVEKAQAEHGEVLGMLSARLGPVLIPESPIADQNMREVGERRSDATQRVRDAATKVAMQTAHVRDIMSRLDT